MSHDLSNPPAWRLIESAADLQHAVNELDQGLGPLAIDAERASGFRYSQRAYLIQVYRREAEAFLIDPISVPSLEPLQEAISEHEWIVHAATQDLACLREVGLVPTRLFDTELAARLLGMPRVNLGQVVSDLLDVTLEKAHSAADWSTRPLPANWLEYAALDVTYLPPLRDALEEQLIEQNKIDFAHQEFEALAIWQARPEHPEPWRRLSGLHALKSPRSLAIARELWLARDELARSRDIAPGRLLPDRSIIAVALEPPRSAGALASVKAFTGRASRSDLDRWWAAIVRGKSSEELPAKTSRSVRDIPHRRSWAQRNPEADARLKAAREWLSDQAAEVNIPLENLLLPDAVRRLAWEPPMPLTEGAVRSRLAELGARPWQQDLTAAGLTEALEAADLHSELSSSSQGDSQ